MDWHASVTLHHTDLSKIGKKFLAALRGAATYRNALFLTIIVPMTTPKIRPSSLTTMVARPLSHCSSDVRRRPGRPPAGLTLTLVTCTSLVQCQDHEGMEGVHKRGEVKV